MRSIVSIRLLTSQVFVYLFRFYLSIINTYNKSVLAACFVFGFSGCFIRLAFASFFLPISLKEKQNPNAHTHTIQSQNIHPNHT